MKWVRLERKFLGKTNLFHIKDYPDGSRGIPVAPSILRALYALPFIDDFIDLENLAEKDGIYKIYYVYVLEGNPEPEKDIADYWLTNEHRFREDTIGKCIGYVRVYHERFNRYDPESLKENVWIKEFVPMGAIDITVDDIYLFKSGDHGEEQAGSDWNIALPMPRLGFYPVEKIVPWLRNVLGIDEKCKMSIGYIGEYELYFPYTGYGSSFDHNDVILIKYREG